MVKRPLDEQYHQVKKDWSSLNSNGWATPMQFRQRQAPGENLVLRAPQKDPFKRSYDEIFSIQQSGSQGFRVFDIDPNYAAHADFACQLDPTVIFQIAGPYGYFAGFGYENESPVNTNWRTFQLDNLAGNWIKIEYLPPRVNDNVTISSNLQNPNNFGNYVSTSATNAEFAEAQYRRQLLLLQFDNNQANPIIAKHGDVFKIPFNTIYLTTNVARPDQNSSITIGVPRIRITVGYNTSIDSVDDRALYASPAFYSQGGLNNQSYHPTPFSICSRDISGLAGNVPVVATSAGSPTYTKELIVNDNSTGIAKGGIYGWITSISYSARMGIGASTDALCDFELGVGNLPFTTQFRRLYYCGGMLNNTVGGEPNFIYQNDVTFNHPLRFNLKKNNCLVMRLRSNATSVDHMFSVQGYCMTNLSGDIFPNGFAQNIPYYPAWLATENPYPLD